MTVIKVIFMELAYVDNFLRRTPLKICKTLWSLFLKILSLQTPKENKMRQTDGLAAASATVHPLLATTAQK